MFIGHLISFHVYLILLIHKFHIRRMISQKELFHKVVKHKKFHFMYTSSIKRNSSYFSNLLCNFIINIFHSNYTRISMVKISLCLTFKIYARKIYIYNYFSLCLLQVFQIMLQKQIYPLRVLQHNYCFRI